MIAAGISTNLSAQAVCVGGQIVTAASRMPQLCSLSMHGRKAICTIR